MSYGYSLKTIEANQAADDGHLGVQLGRKCIKHEITVSEVARHLGVSRQTIYNWFSGAGTPCDEFIGPVREYIAKLPS